MYPKFVLLGMSSMILAATAQLNMNIPIDTPILTTDFGLVGIHNFTKKGKPNVFQYAVEGIGTKNEDQPLIKNVSMSINSTYTVFYFNSSRMVLHSNRYNIPRVLIAELWGPFDDGPLKMVKATEKNIARALEFRGSGPELEVRDGQLYSCPAMFPHPFSHESQVFWRKKASKNLPPVCGPVKFFALCQNNTLGTETDALAFCCPKYINGECVV